MFRIPGQATPSSPSGSPNEMKAIKDRIQKGKKPKAVIGVHLYGQSFKVEDILSICNKYEIWTF